ncbi:hypothetical protein BH24CHL4_BH24CHL4_15770 [soil metagenome]
MAERKPVLVEPKSEAGELLRLAGEKPITVESDGILYRIEREERATIENRTTIQPRR